MLLLKGVIYSAPILRFGALLHDDAFALPGVAGPTAGSHAGDFRALNQRHCLPTPDEDGLDEKRPWTPDVESLIPSELF